MDPVGEQLSTLLDTLKNSEFGQVRRLTERKNDITILDQDGRTQTIKRSILLNALQISHVYVEILKNSKIFELYPKMFPAEICPVLHDILSFVHTKEYYHIDDLIFQMKMRELIAQADVYYPRLRQAVINADMEETAHLAEYARLVPENNPEGSPLYHGVKLNHISIVGILLAQGAYVLEMDKDGSRFPLEVAYQNGNREMVRLLIQHHGATVKTYSVTQHNTDHVLRACAQNKDYEILSMMAPEAFSIETSTWLSPEMFPDMNEKTIKALSSMSEIRIAWTLDVIRPIYEKKDYSLCKRMLLQGSTQEVVEYFVAADDYEMFEASIQCHAVLNPHGEFGPAFERGGKWFDTLKAHVSKGYNLDQIENSYFSTMLNDGEIERCLSIMQVRSGEFPGLDGYIVWPDKVNEPRKYINLVRAYMEKNQSCKERPLFVEDIIRCFGDEKLAKEYYALFPVDKNIDWRKLRDSIIDYDYIRRVTTNNPFAGAELVRSYFLQNIEDKERKAYELVDDLIGRSCTRGQTEKIYDEANLNALEIRCLYILRALLDCVPLQKINSWFKKQYEGLGIESASQYATSGGKVIRSEPFMKMLTER